MKAILSIFLVILFIASNVQLHIGTHFCGGHAVKSEMMFGHHSLDCGMTDMEESCDGDMLPYDNNISKKECCSDEFIAIQIDTDFNKRLLKDMSSKSLLQALECTVTVLCFQNNSEGEIFNVHPPPRWSNDIQVLFQTFLI